jgi:hypothetical protein
LKAHRLLEVEVIHFEVAKGFAVEAGLENSRTLIDEALELAVRHLVVNPAQKIGSDVVSHDKT